MKASPYTNPQTELSLITTLHNEGALCEPSLRSLHAALERVREEGFACEWLVVGDQLDAATRAAVQPFAKHFRLFEVDVGDAGLARNAGVSAARGRWVAIADGDDLYGRDWLIQAIAYARTEPKWVVWHPQWTLYFGASLHAFEHLPSDAEFFHPEDLLEHNLYTALCVAPRELFVRVPYVATRTQQGWGYEDWHWNCEVLAAGAMHQVIPETVHFVRLRNEQGRREEHLRHHTLPPPSAYFQNLVRTLSTAEKDYLLNSEFSEISRQAPVVGPASFWKSALLQQEFFLNWAWRWRARRNRAPLPFAVLKEWQKQCARDRSLPEPTPERVESLALQRMPRSKVGLAFVQLLPRFCAQSAVSLELLGRRVSVNNYEFAPLIQQLTVEQVAWLLARLLQHCGAERAEIRGEGEIFMALLGYREALSRQMPIQLLPQAGVCT